ncbi:MAG TPA: protoporphyrinogen oxidase [Candidatus Acidoferrales bacterium]
MADPRQRVIVIGGGISGLACAYRLQQLGVAVTVFESADHAGGVIDTNSPDGFLFESGPQSFQGTETLLALIRELGLEPNLQVADSKAPRYMVRNKQLQRLPMSPPSVITSPFLGLRSRWKLISEPMRRTKPPKEDESIASFVRRKFGNEILDYLVAPFVSGVYAGDPEQLSLRAAFPSIHQWEREYGSAIRGAIKSRPDGTGKTTKPALCSFRKGVAELPRAIAGKIGASFQNGTSVSAIGRSSPQVDSPFEVRHIRRGAAKGDTAAAVVIATPAYAASTLINLISPTAAQALLAIAYAPVAVVASAYERDQIADALFGFGFLIPRKEKIRTLGTVWNSSLFPGRGPEGTVVMTSFVGGATDLDILKHSEREISRIVEQDNAALLGIRGAPIATKVWSYSRAIPQYNLGHGQIVERIRHCQQENPGIFFAGNYLDGPSVGNCVESAYRTAEAVKGFVEQARPGAPGLA